MRHPIGTYIFVIFFKRTCNQNFTVEISTLVLYFTVPYFMLQYNPDVKKLTSTTKPTAALELRTASGSSDFTCKHCNKVFSDNSNRFDSQIECCFMLLAPFPEYTVMDSHMMQTHY